MLDLELGDKLKGPVDKVKTFMGDSFRYFAFKVNNRRKNQHENEGKVASRHVIDVSDSGLISLIGGKST